MVADVNEGAGQDSVRQIEAGDGRAAFVLADVAVEAEVRSMVAFAEQYFGGLDVLVNNAGGAPEPYFPEAEHWGRNVDVNLRGVMLGTQFGIRVMRRRGGAGEISAAVMMFVRDDTLAGRVMVWPDGETWRLVPVDSRY